jgi:DNA invertase Pin-like site-specific DNA recombinase
MTTAVRTSTAVGYFRVSSPGQAGERHVSLEAQATQFHSYCLAHDLEPVKTFTDIASGRKDNRPEYRSMLDYVTREGIGNVVVLFLDRFGRNPQELLPRVWELKDQGITVQSINEDLEEELMLLLRAGIAGQESKRTGERIRLALREAVSRGKYVSKLPFGYTKFKDFEGERIVQVPQEAEAVRLAYELATRCNMGFRSMAQELNRQGYRTKQGKLFSSQTVKVVLSNPAMIGHQVFWGKAKEPIINVGAYPAILSTEEWDKLQTLFEVRRGGRHRSTAATSNYLLTGILRCGNCGGAMQGYSKGKDYKYYRCSWYAKARDFCAEARSHRQKSLEDAVLEHLSQYSDPEMVMELLEAQGQETDNRDEAELTRVITRLAELERGFLNDLDRVDRAVMTEAEYLKRQEVRRREQEELQPRKAELEAAVAAQKDIEAQAAAVPVKVRSFMEDFRDMEVPQAKAVLQSIIKAAHVFKDGRIELEFRS